MRNIILLIAIFLSINYTYGHEPYAALESHIDEHVSSLDENEVTHSTLEITECNTQGEFFFGVEFMVENPSPNGYSVTDQNSNFF